MSQQRSQMQPQPQSQHQPIHICFYSTKCEWSKAFLTEIANLPYKNDFRFICVDPGSQRPQLPSWLKKVPTLVISGENEPRTDSDVMNWLYERKMKDGKTGLASAQGGLPQNSGRGGNGANGDDLQPFMFSAMGGIYDDAYSSYDDTNIDSSNHGFSFLNGQDAVGTREAQNFGGGGLSSGRGDHRSQKEKMFDAQMEAYQRERNAGIPKMPSRQ